MKIGANIIFRNEEKVLPRLLKSLLPLVDGIYALDTGSSDKSVEIVENFIKDNNLMGEVVTDATCTEIIDGEECFIYHKARNKALDIIIGKCDIGFWIDADEQVVLPKDFDRSVIINGFKSGGADVGVTTVVYGGNRYGRNSFFRTSKPFKWSHPVHELLECSEPTRSGMVPVEILVTPDGATWNEADIRKKYLKHALILKREVEQTNDPRDIFYCAASYKDAGETDKAIEWYRKRIEMDSGFHEERYYSQWYIGLLTAALQKPTDQIIFEYMKSHELDPLRGEGILNIICELQNKGMWNTSYIFSKLAVEKYHGKNPYPQRHLFLDHGTYESKTLEAHNLNCEKTNRMDEINNGSLEVTYNYLCQSQSDINYHLPKLKECAEKYGRCCEVGVRWVVSTYALMMGKPKKLVSYDINYHPSIEKAKSMAQKEGIDFTFIQHDILTTEIDECDFLFLDSLHNYSQLSQELRLHHKKVTRAIGFHDINTFGLRDETPSNNEIQGLLPAIAEFIQEHPGWKQVYRTEENNGFLILEKQ